ncbi:divergent PAP2 family protein [Ruoffia tabacinasalis]|uniref:divergent PAP2 family protein n=1 Tax=Ruoffia tabacinasalis TaxID=87458 RepID=UPI0030D0927C
MNFPLIASLSSILFAQLIKYPIAYLTNRKSAKLNLITSTGGMPSSHSAAVSSLTTALILEYGFNSPYVAISTVFAVIIMFDSMGVRRQSGEQGIVLDILARKHLAEIDYISDDISYDEVEDNPLILSYDIDDYERMIINRYLGHKPSEVIVGTLTGGFVAIFLRLVLL